MLCDRTEEGEKGTPLFASRVVVIPTPESTKKGPN